MASHRIPDVDTPEALERLFDHAARRRAVGNTAEVGFRFAPSIADGSDRVRRRRLVLSHTGTAPAQVVDDDPSPVYRQQLGDLRTDTAPRPGHDGTAAGKIDGHVVSPRLG